MDEVAIREEMLTMSIRITTTALLVTVGILCGTRVSAQTQPANGEKTLVSLSIDESLEMALHLVDALEQGDDRGELYTERYNEAQSMASQVLNSDPLNVTAGYILGRLAILSGRPRDALPRIEAYAADPAGKADWYAHKLLGDLYIVSYPKFAKAEYSLSVQLAAGEADAHYGLAQANIKLNRADEAIENARRAVQIDTDGKPKYRVALAEALLLATDRHDEAVQEAQEAVRLSEQLVRTKPGELKLLEDLKNHYALLVRALSSALSLYPERAENVVLLSKAWQDQADLERLITYHSILNAVEQAHQNPALAASGDLLYEEARLNHLVGRDDRAAELAKQVISENPMHGPARDLLKLIKPEEVIPQEVADQQPATE